MHPLILGAVLSSVVFYIRELYGTFRQERIVIEGGEDPFPNEVYWYILYRMVLTILLLIGVQYFFPIRDFGGWNLLYYIALFTLVILLTLLIETLTRVLITQVRFSRMRKEEKNKEKDKEEK